MKKVLFVAIIATLIAVGCEKTEIINPQPEPGLTFSTNMGKLTKAPDADNGGNINLQEQNFRVWAYAEYEDQNTDAIEKYNIYDGIKNLAVTYNAPSTEGAEGTWGTDKQYFWPGVGKELTFLAVSAGKIIGGNNEFLGVSGNDTDSLTINFIQTEDENKTITGIGGLSVNNFNVTDQNYNRDLMVADGVTQHQEDKIVNLKFHHTLSKVEFLFTTNTVNNTEEPINVWVQKVEVKGLATQGTLTATMSKGEAASGEGVSYEGVQNEASFGWQLNTTTSGDFTDDWDETYTGEDFPTSIDGVPVAADADDKIAMKITNDGSADHPAQNFTTWLMLPQNIEGKLVEITYLINERKFTSIFSLSNSTLKTWAANQHIRYKVNLSPNLISFEADVEEWTPTTDVEHNN